MNKNQNTKHKIPNTNKGITLIALVITIVVMLILVSVTISMAVNGGLFEKAQEAGQETNKAVDAEQQLANGQVKIDGKVYDSIDDFINKDNIWPINWNSLEVVGNASLIYTGIPFVKIADVILSATQLRQTSLSISNEDWTIRLACSQVVSYEGVDVAAFVAGDDQIFIVSVTQSGYNDELKLEIPETGLYTVDFGSMGEDGDFSLYPDKLDLEPEAQAILVEDGTFYFAKTRPIAIGETYNNSTVIAAYTGIETIQPVVKEEVVDETTSDYWVENVPWINEDLNFWKVLKVVVEDEICPISTAGWFVMMENCTEMDLELLNTSNTTNMSLMFHFCRSLEYIKFGDSWDTSNVTDMSAMFYDCSSLVQIDISDWELKNVTSMKHMFASCPSLTTLGDVSKWNVSNVQYMSNVFAKCTKLSVDCSKWNISNVRSHNNFNLQAPNVILPLAWQTSAQ